MARLNNRAFKILRAEVEKLAGNDRLSQLEKKLVLEELEKLRSQKGLPASLEELRKIVIPTYRYFSIKVLDQAVKANQKSGIWGKIKTASILVIGSVGALGVLGTVSDLPKTTQNAAVSVAQNTPTPAVTSSPTPDPSTLSIDDNYREAITNNYWEQNRTMSQLQGIIYQLQKVKPGTTAYREAQQLSKWAQQNLKQMQP